MTVSLDNTGKRCKVTKVKGRLRLLNWKKKMIPSPSVGKMEMQHYLIWQTLSISNKQTNYLSLLRAAYLVLAPHIYYFKINLSYIKTKNIKFTYAFDMKLMSVLKISNTNAGIQRTKPFSRSKYKNLQLTH